MKLIQKTIACVLLIGFSVSFATVEAHGAGLCDETTQQVQKHSSHSASMQAESTAPDETIPDSANSNSCHCQGSVNCQFDGAVSNSLVVPELVLVQASLSSSLAQSIFLDGFSRPPRAI